MRSIRRLSSISALVGAFLAAAPALAEDAAPLPAPTYRGEIVIPTGLKIAGTEFGGISGLDYDAASGTFYAISDDRSEKAPARFYRLIMDLSEKGIAGLDIAATDTLTGLDGKPFPVGGIDPEAIRVDAARQRIYWSSEGDAFGKPQIFVAGMNGKAEKTLDLPDAFLPNAGGTRGINPNLALEGLAISPDGTTLYAITENALVQDGDKATFEVGSPSRLLAIDLDTGKPGTEYVYETDRIPFRPKQAGGSADNGVSEMLSLPDGRLVTVERSYVAGVGNHIAFYVVSLEGADEISGKATIAGATPLKKALWFKIDEGDFGGLDIDNIECLTFGPEIAGERSIVIASDNNFSRHQASQFLLFTAPAGD
ncbi:esterase-like activity of phytase family protein [Aurantimonas sp. VKM B-3413]|uniref:esterase-like activity of phytase family protein n=1 Tax=Aurantimonas sp. VKM B-3413 TaxID=2779401 RepID=UPI001E3BC96A|nr:esterase-like activity of phytase family protein [Aurantimonas sp. VKM B-3413]MCB8840696.1 esterase-like activity of phytase family protein [Aurantimonas sp. VKM B-3413]